MKRSTSVTLTLVVTLATVRAQQGDDPCAAATLNGEVCQATVRNGGYYRGAANQSSAVKCPRPIRGGFGSTAATHGGGSTAGS
jgi:hypothetical protein